MERVGVYADVDWRVGGEGLKGIHVSTDVIEESLQLDLDDFFNDVFCEQTDEHALEPALLLVECKCCGGIQLFEIEGVVDKYKVALNG